MTSRSSATSCTARPCCCTARTSGGCAWRPASRANSAWRSGSSRGWPTSRSARSSSTWRWPPAAEAVRAEHGGVTFVAGCEHSLFTNGLIPGPHTLIRLKLLRFMPRLQPRVTRKLDALLEQAHHARATRVPRPDHLRRRVLGAGRLVALRRRRRQPVPLRGQRGDLHAAAARAGHRRQACRDHRVRLRRARRRRPQRAGRVPDRAVVSLDAEDLPRPHRDEQVQATYLRELLELYEAESIAGAFVFTFAMPDFPHRPDDPEHDLDMAGFGVVKVTRRRLGAQGGLPRARPRATPPRGRARATRRAPTGVPT